MSLLREIQDAAIDGEVELPTLLRKCKVLAARLGNDEFSNWVDAELNGYKEVDNLPDYRIIKVNSKGHFSGFAGSALRSASIPLICIDQKFRKALSHSYLMEPAAAIEALVSSSEEGSAQEPWPPDLVVHVGHKIYENMNCMQAWKEIPMGAIIGAADAIRNRVLSFVLEIEAAAPDAGEAPLHSNPVPQEEVSQIFNTYISGNVQNVATGSSYFTQSAEASISQGDFESLAEFLRAQGLEDADIKDLKDAIHKDEDCGHGADMGPEKMGWVSRMYNKAKAGAWKVSTSVAMNVLTVALNRYLGL